MHPVGIQSLRLDGILKKDTLTARGNEGRTGQFDDGEETQVLQINIMAKDRQGYQFVGEAIEEGEEGQDGHYGVDEPGEILFGRHCVFFE